MHGPAYVYRAVVVSVYDGDTIRCDIDKGFGDWRHNETLRLTGINTPEIRGEERSQGLISRDALAARIVGKEVIIQTEKDRKEKWGRYLATVWLDGENINQWLIDQNLAEAYMP